MNYYAFPIIDNGTDFYGEVRDAQNNVVIRVVDKSKWSDLVTLANEYELFANDPTSKIYTKNADNWPQNVNTPQRP